MSDKKDIIKQAMDSAESLHKFMTDYIRLAQEEKPLVVSAILIALKNGDKNLITTDDVLSSVEYVLSNSGLKQERIDELLRTFEFIRTHNGLGEYMKHCIDVIKSDIQPMMQEYIEQDVISAFYGKFSGGTGGNGRGLGIVLTPKYIVEFMCDLLEINENSIVLDTCTGTGGFLISAMSKMRDDVYSKYATNEERSLKMKSIKSGQLIGVEYLSNMYAMASANMIYRCDGELQIIKGSCFDFQDEIKALKPTVALINPPYSQKGEGLQEIDFINFTLNCLEVGGKLAAIVPMSVAIDIKKDRLPKREELLKNHRLDAVLSMNDQIFEPYASTVTCIIVMTAHIPHEDSPYHKTFFGYFKDDGWYQTRKGRVDSGKWESIKNNWLDKYFNNQIVAGLSVTQKVDFSDEWCAEAYMETDYSTLTDDDFIKSIKEYAAFKMLNSDLFEV